MKSKTLRIGRLYFRVCVANSSWAIIKQDDSIFKMWIHVGPAVTRERDSVFDVVIGPVAATFAWLPRLTKLE